VSNNNFQVAFMPYHFEGYEFADDMQDVWSRYNTAIVKVCRDTSTYHRAMNTEVTSGFTDHFAEEGEWNVNLFREDIGFTVLNGTRFQVSQPLTWVATMQVTHRIHRHTIKTLMRSIRIAALAGRILTFEGLKGQRRSTVGPDAVYSQWVVIGGTLDTSEPELAPIVTGEEIRESEEAS